MVIPREVLNDPVETTRQPLTKAYLIGSLHDATVRKITYRIGAKDLSFIKFLQKGILNLGYRAWIYREGNKRNYYIVEFGKSILNGFKITTKEDKIDYIRGYFDTDGAISRSKKVRYYIYFSQKNIEDLRNLREFLVKLGINCGIIHNPSIKSDSGYFRFYVRALSYQRFARIIGSWHPVKSKFLRVKI